MLVLARKTNERIILRDKATGAVTAVVTLVGVVSQGKAKIGIEAPRGTEIQREEIDMKAHPECYLGRGTV